MATNDYHFITHWRVEGTVQEVYDIISDNQQLARWWPSVYLDTQELQAGDERGIDRVINLHTRGWLPYSLWWQARTVEAEAPHRLAIAAEGDFVGRGIWTLEQDGAWVNIHFDWKIRADKPLLRYLSFLCKPFFSANHGWAMDRGEESLRLEVARRRAASSQERSLIPAPPGPNNSSIYWLAAGLVAVVILVKSIKPARQ